MSSSVMPQTVRLHRWATARRVSEVTGKIRVDGQPGTHAVSNGAPVGMTVAATQVLVGKEPQT